MLCTKSHLYVAEVTKSHIGVFYELNYILIFLALTWSNMTFN